MRIELSTWPAVERYFDQGNDLVVMAIGSTEEHGRHNPLGTDTLAPNLLLDLIEWETDKAGAPVLISPTIPFGNADDLLGFPGTLSIGYDMLRDLVAKLTDQLYDYGARRFLIINGHGPNIKPITEVCEDLNRRGCLAALANWWLMAGEIDPAWSGGHGGAEETAAVMAVSPGLVDKSAYGPMGLANDISDELVTVSWGSVSYKGVTVGLPRDACRYAANGWMGPDDPTKADPGWGTQMMKGVATYLVDFIGALRRAPLPEPMTVRTTKAYPTR